MFSNSSLRKFGNILKKQNIFQCTTTRCDDSKDEDSSPSLIEQADAAIEKNKLKIKTPLQWESVRNQLHMGTVGSYDGFRAIVQKQVNLNTVVSHL